MGKLGENFGSGATSQAGEDSKKNKARNLGLCHHNFPWTHTSEPSHRLVFIQFVLITRDKECHLLLIPVRVSINFISLEFVMFRVFLDLNYIYISHINFFCPNSIKEILVTEIVPTVHQSSTRNSTMITINTTKNC